MRNERSIQSADTQRPVSFERKYSKLFEYFEDHADHQEWLRPHSKTEVVQMLSQHTDLLGSYLPILEKFRGDGESYEAAASNAKSFLEERTYEALAENPTQYEELLVESARTALLYGLPNYELYRWRDYERNPQLKEALHSTTQAIMKSAKNFFDWQILSHFSKDMQENPFQFELELYHLGVIGQGFGKDGNGLEQHKIKILTHLGVEEFPTQNQESILENIS